MRKAIILFTLLLFAVYGCSSVQPVQKSNLTPGMVKTTITKGETTQNEIMKLFGAPNIVTKSKSGNEVWTYDKVSIESGSSGAYGTIVVAGIAGGKSSTSTKTFTLMIEFDENDVVKDYSYRSSSF